MEVVTRGARVAAWTWLWWQGGIKAHPDLSGARGGEGVAGGAGHELGPKATFLEMMDDVQGAFCPVSN